MNSKKVKVKVKDFQELTAATDESLYKSISSAGIVLEASCGGNGTCGKCKIKVLEGEVIDKNGMPAKSAEDGFHLACQIFPFSDLTIDKIKQMGVSAKGEVSKINIAKKDLQQIIKKVPIRPEYPKLKNSYSLQEMINKASAGLKPMNPDVLKQLAQIAPLKDQEATLVLVNEEITSIEEGDTSKDLYGVAFDIGTTTVAGILVNLINGKAAAAASASNLQIPFGADVISRIQFTREPEGLHTLSSLIRKTLNTIILELCAKVNISIQSVYLATIAGNSTMEHLLLGVSPQSLSIIPYVTTFNFLAPIPGQDLGLDLNPGGRVQFLPNIASFVGADTVAGIIAVDQDLTDKLTLFIDLGTNGELVLGNRNRLLVSSTAAGPAFEGSQLSYGMRAVEGAIDTVKVKNGDLKVTTINDVKPRGICGSGVVMAVAELYKAGAISKSGRIVGDPNSVEYPNLIKERMRTNHGKREFILAFAEETEIAGEVIISQQDIREIQLVKSSIYTGVQILAEKFGVNIEEIEQILIAGAFGNYIDIDSALAVGLLPGSRRDIIRSVGNAAGEGSVKALLSESHLNRCFKVTEKAEFIELANDIEFQKRFIKNLSFPK
ncbi:MAG: ASKHA domain-containing protein [Candidatus Contubernalis sp.]|nr:ASKHA domain-containing protein [Candidatus Contubernalis sp.]